VEAVKADLKESEAKVQNVLQAALQENETKVQNTLQTGSMPEFETSRGITMRTCVPSTTA